MKLSDYNRIAESLDDARTQHRMGVVSIHGMNTRAVWQKEVNVALADCGIRHSMVDYGWIVKGVLWRRNVEPVVKDIVQQYLDHRHRGLDVGAIAHSYGTLCLGKGLHWNPSLRMARLILWGCILPQRFDWATLFGRRQVQGVLNETCVRDRWPRVARFLIPDSGPAGCYGFLGGHESIIESRYEYTEHSRLGSRLHCETVWAPYLTTGTLGN